MPDPSLIPADIPPLPVLLRQLNRSLEWNAARMGEWMGWDSAQVSRILKINSRLRPTDATLNHLARRYQEAGLTSISFEFLKGARDYGGRIDAVTYAIPDHWQRLVKSVLTLDPELQDKLFTRWQEELTFALWLTFRGQHNPPPDQPDSD